MVILHVFSYVLASCGILQGTQLCIPVGCERSLHHLEWLRIPAVGKIYFGYSCGIHGVRMTVHPSLRFVG